MLKSQLIVEIRTQIKEIQHAKKTYETSPGTATISLLSML